MHKQKVRANQKIGLGLIGLGFGLFALAVFGLQQDLSWIAQPFYAYVWWAYILCLDGFNLLRRGDSLLTKRAALFWAICIWSISFWFFFELLNIRFRNWYYVGVFTLENLLAAMAFAVVAFATVFMGIFETIDALTATGLWKNWRGKKRSCSIRVSYLIQALGAAMALAAVLSPVYLAPLIWGSLTFLVDPWNYRRGARSILRDFEAGNFGAIARIFLAGLICGVVWESLNFFAPQKWIYTVRGLENFKLFEMPLLGFLGFPALAFDAMAAFSALSYWFLGNRTWERPEDLAYELPVRRRAPNWLFWAVLPAHVMFWGAVGFFGTNVNIGSVELSLADLGLHPGEERMLRDRGIRRPRQLLKALNAENGKHLVRDMGWDRERLSRVWNRGRLFTFKGIGAYYGALLETAGVTKPEDLGQWQPEPLHSELRRAASRYGIEPPRLDFVRVWVFAAQDRGLVLRAKSDV